MTRAEREALRSLLAEARDAPGSSVLLDAQVLRDDGWGWKMADLIAAAVNALPALLDQVEALEKLAEEAWAKRRLYFSERNEALHAERDALKAEVERLREWKACADALVSTPTAVEAERDQARARVAELESEHEHCEDLAAAWERIATLEAALRKYGRHLDTTYTPDGESRHDGCEMYPCTCGLDAALAGGG